MFYFIFLTWFMQGTKWVEIHLGNSHFYMKYVNVFKMCLVWSYIIKLFTVGTFIQSYRSGLNRTLYKWNIMNTNMCYRAIKKLNNINN